MLLSQYRKLLSKSSLTTYRYEDFAVDDINRTFDVIDEAMESWEAADETVRQAVEEWYDTLLGDPGNMAKVSAGRISILRKAKQLEESAWKKFLAMVESVSRGQVEETA